MARLPYPSLRQGLLGAWCPSLGATGDTLLDRSARGNNGTLINMSGQDNWRAGDGGLSLQFDGVDDYVTGVLGGQQPVRSVTFWARPAAVVNAAAAAAFVVQIRVGTNLSWHVSFGAATILLTNEYITVTDTSSNYRAGVTDGGSLPAQEWSHISVVESGVLHAIYVNGVARTVSRNASVNRVTPLANALRLGCFDGDGGGPRSFFAGQLDDVRIYDRVLTLAEIRLLASQRGIGLRPVPTAYWFQQYPLSIDTNRVYAKESGLWVPGDLKARRSGAWRNSAVSAKQAGAWVPTPPALPTLEPETAAYIAAVEAADERALEVGVVVAINDFIGGCKEDGTWDAIKASCILMGARTLAGALTPLVGPAPTNYANNFVAADYNRKTGLKATTTDKALDTNRAANSDSLNDHHLASYVTERPTEQYAALLGNGNFNVSGSTFVELFQSNAYYVHSRTGTTFTSAPTANLATGFLGLSRASSTAFDWRASGSSSSISQGPTINTASGNYWVFAAGQTTPAKNGVSRQAFYSFGSALSLAQLDARVTALYNAISAAIP